MTAVKALSDFARGLDCAKDYLGREHQAEHLLQRLVFRPRPAPGAGIPGPASLAGIGGIRDKITLYAMFDNFLNFLDNDWNVQRRRNFAGLQDIASISGVDSAGRYIITGFNGEADYKADNFINVSSSVWRIKVGASYKF